MIMRLTTEGKLIRTDIWREGAYLDLWSVPHFLSGMVVGLALYFFGFDLRSAFVIAFLLLVGYEMFEVIAQIRETRWNRTLDVVVGMASFTPTFVLAPGMTHDAALALFVAVTACDCILSFLGWRASQKAAEFERKFRAAVQRERELFAARRAAMASWRERSRRQEL